MNNIKSKSPQGNKTSLRHQKISQEKWKGQNQISKISIHVERNIIQSLELNWNIFYQGLLLHVCQNK